MASAFGSEGDALEKKPVKKRLEYYKVHIKSDNTNTKMLCYWCFSPSQMMQDLLDEGARSIILTSGTLSPIESLKIEMKM
jgi:Rad3-related DNA helicase